MKRTIILSALVVFALIGTASAQDTTTKATDNTPRRSCYVDANNNGICDKFEDGTCTVGNGEGLMNGTVRGQGLRDGSGRGKGQGEGRGRCGNAGFRNDNKGRDFVDADNDGICDRRETCRQTPIR